MSEVETQTTPGVATAAMTPISHMLQPQQTEFSKQAARNAKMAVPAYVEARVKQLCAQLQLQNIPIGDKRAVLHLRLSITPLKLMQELETALREHGDSLPSEEWLQQWLTKRLSSAADVTEINFMRALRSQKPGQFASVDALVDWVMEQKRAMPDMPDSFWCYATISLLTPSEMQAQLTFRHQDGKADRWVRWDDFLVVLRSHAHQYVPTSGAGSGSSGAGGSGSHKSALSRRTRRSRVVAPSAGWRAAARSRARRASIPTPFRRLGASRCRPRGRTAFTSRG
jgi:hypothetical protein